MKKFFTLHILKFKIEKQEQILSEKVLKIMGLSIPNNLNQPLTMIKTGKLHFTDWNASQLKGINVYLIK